MSWILLVEGPDDYHVIRNFLRERGIDVPAEALKAGGGDTPLLDLFRATLVGGVHRVVGAIIDADSNLGARWQSIRDRLGDVGYRLPDIPAPEGTIVRGERTAGIWLMPDNTIPGKLENFVELLIPRDDALWQTARSTVEAIPDDLRRFSPPAIIKAEIHTWLAWQEEPGTRMGAAITKRYLQTHGDVADAFVEWIRQLAAADREE